MSSDREFLIRQRAYEIWEAEGQVEGRHEEHWHRAERELAQEEEGANNPTGSDATEASGAAPPRTTRGRRATLAPDEAGAEPSSGRRSGKRSGETGNGPETVPGTMPETDGGQAVSADAAAAEAVTATRRRRGA